MRALRRLLLLASGLAGAFALAVALALALLHTDAGRAIARDRLASALARATGARVRLGALETPRLGTIVLRDLVVSLAGQSLVRVRRIEVALALPLPVPPTLRLDRLQMDGLAAHLVHRDGGFGTTPSDDAASPLALRVRDLRVDGSRVAVWTAGAATPRRVIVSSLALAGSLAAGPRGQRLDVTALRATPRRPGIGALAGDSTLLNRSAGPLDFRARLALDAGGTIDVHGRAATSGPFTYRVTAAAHDVAPALFDPAWPGDPTALTLRAHGRGPRHRATGRLVARGGRVRWQGRAHLASESTYELSAEGDVTDLRAFTDGTAGRFPFRLEADAGTRTREPARARLSVELGRGAIAGLSFRQATAGARLERGELHVERLRVDADRLRIAATGRADLGRQAGELRAEVEAPDRGRLTAVLSLARAPRGWTGTVRELVAMPPGLPPWHTTGPATFVLDGGARVTDLRLRSGAQQVALSGARTAGGALAGTVAFAGLDLPVLCAAAGRTCAGTASGRLEVDGTMAAPRFTLAANAREVATGPLARTTVDAALVHERGRARGTVTIGTLGGSVVLAGGVPAPLPGLASGGDALDVTVTARRLALARLPRMAPGLVRTADGRARADLHIGGTWQAPRPDGTVTLRAAVLELAPSGAPWEDVHVVLHADGARSLLVERCTATGGRGTLGCSGQLDFTGGIVPVADLRFALDRFLAVDRPILEAQVNGTLRVRGPLDAPTVRGRLYVPEGTVRPTFLPAANAPTEADPTIEVVGLPGAAPGTPPAGLGDLTLGLTITLGDGMRIRRRDADIQLGGTLQVTRTPPEPLEVRGAVKVERGWYTFSGRRFRLRPGAVRFAGGPIADAELDIEAGYRAGEYDVTVAVQGTVAKPELLLASDPPLDEPDVLAVLLVGRPSGELNDGERLAVQAEAASLAVGYVVPGLTGALEEALPIEQVQVSPEQVRVSHRFGSDVFVSLSQQFVGWAGQTLAVEYAITPRLSVELSTSSRGSGAVDFFWRRRY